MLLVGFPLAFIPNSPLTWVDMMLSRPLQKSTAQ